MLAVIGTGELLVILGLVLVLFGGKKLPELAKNLGQGMREFKKACNGEEEHIDSSCKGKSVSCCGKEKEKCTQETDKVDGCS